MDASEYLRNKKATQMNYIRRQAPVDAGLRTMMLGKAASGPRPAATTHIPACCTSRVAHGGSGAAEVIHPVGCDAGAICASLSNVYTAPYIALPCCPMEYAPSTSYIRACTKPCVQTTPRQAAVLEAAARKCC